MRTRYLPLTLLSMLHNATLIAFHPPRIVRLCNHCNLQPPAILRCSDLFVVHFFQALTLGNAPGPPQCPLTNSVICRPNLGGFHVARTLTSMIVTTSHHRSFRFTHHCMHGRLPPTFKRVGNTSERRIFNISARTPNLCAWHMWYAAR